MVFWPNVSDIGSLQASQGFESWPERKKWPILRLQKNVRRSVDYIRSVVIKSYKVEIKKSLYDLSRWLNLMNYIYIWKRIRLPALGNSRLWCSSPFVLTSGRLQANESSKPNPNEKMSIWCSKKYVGSCVGATEEQTIQLIADLIISYNLTMFVDRDFYDVTIHENLVYQI